MYDLETIVGCVPSPLELMRCHSDHFRLIQPILTFFNVFMLFSMFACVGLITASLDYLCVSHTIVYLCDAFPTLSDFLLTLFIFTAIDIPMFWLFIVSVDRTIAIGSDFDPYGLLVISDPSDAISTSPRLFLLIFYLPLPFYIEQYRTSFLRLRKTLHRLDLTQTVFPCVPR